MFDVCLILAAAEPSATGGGLLDMLREIVETFHITVSALISQFVCVLIVAFLLKKFAFGPVQEMLDKRRQRIADGEANLIEVKKKLKESEQHTQKIIDEANEDAKRLIEEAKTSASAFSEKKAQEAVTAAQGIIAKAEEAAKAEREQMAAELKSQFGRLVTAATTGVTGKVLNEEDQNRLAQEAMTAIEQ